MTIPSLFGDEFQRGTAEGIAETEARFHEERQIIRDRLNNTEQSSGRCSCMVLYASNLYYLFIKE